MIRARSRFRELGFVAPTVLFVLATIGITASATIGVWEAYDKFLRKPRESAELEQLRHANAERTNEITELSEELLLATARELEARGFVAQRPGKVSEAITMRGLDPRDAALLHALKVVGRAMDAREPATLTSAWTADSRNRIDRLLRVDGQRIRDRLSTRVGNARLQEILDRGMAKDRDVEE